MKRKNKTIKKEDVFLTEDSKINLENATVVHSSMEDIQDELRNLNSFVGFSRELRGNSLTFGDY